MQNISDIIQGIARQRGRTDANPLALLRTLDGRPGERITHLSVGSDLGQAWVALTGEPFHPHQSHALAALRRGDPVALRANSSAVATTLRLLTYALLTPEPASASLVITYDSLTARNLYDQFAHDNRNLPQSLRVSLALAGEKQPNPYARVVISSVDQVHARLLRHHDRAWELLWARLRMISIPEIDRFSGIPGAHLADLLLRTRRVAAAHTPPADLSIVATLSGVAAPEAALAAALGAPWRIIPADDDIQNEITLAVWRGSSARLKDAADIAMALQRDGYYVHIACDPLERAVIEPIIGETDEISIGPDLRPMHVLIQVGYPSAPGRLQRALHSGYHAVILVLGELPHEQAIAQRPELLLTLPPAEWPSAPANAYVTAQHILCAANELPLAAAEVESWGAQEIVERLVGGGQLVDLPDIEVCWKPGPQADDPYAEFHLLAPSGSGIRATSEQRAPLSMLDPTIFERWAYSGGALPPGAGGLRVLARDEEHGSIVLRLENSGRRSFPLRRSNVAVREVRQTRSLAGGTGLSWGRTVVDEEIYAAREMTPGSQPTEHRIDPPLKTRWIALACWFELHAPLQVLGQFIGWSLASALSLRALVRFTDLVPCYDHEQRRLYMVDAHPGGSGAAVWLFSNAEQILPIAYDIAYACRSDPLLEPLSRVDMDWLLAVLGRTAPDQRRAAEVATPAQRSTAPREAARPQPAEPAPPIPQDQPFIELPPRANRPTPETPARPPTQPPSSKPASPPASSTPPRQEPPASPPASSTPSRQEPPAREPTREPPSSKSASQRRAEPQESRSQQQFGFEAPGRKNTPAEPPKPSTEPPKPSAAPPTPPARSPARQPEPPEEEGPPDAAALIARLRRQRQQQEAARGTSPKPQARQPSQKSDKPAKARFRVGDRVFCLPYGDGTVRESRIEGESELLLVDFPEHGELEIDPVVNLVRLIEQHTNPEDDLL